MPNIPGLRSPYEKVGRLVYFGRMLDKIRLHKRGLLPADYVANLGDANPGVFDHRCCKFLGVPFHAITEQTLAGGGDEDVLAWVEHRGGPRTDDECAVWNGFMMKRGWRDHPDVVGRLRFRIAEANLQGRPIETFFDFIDFDEGRDPSSTKPWEKV
jgi:gluconokinase